jgi:26S proteasome non-ATPase regulatory subunit 9
MEPGEELSKLNTFENGVAEEYVENLIKQKDVLENEIASLIKFLKTPGNFGLSGGLIDEEGFPISDVGKIIEVRTARHELVCKQNDHVDLMKQIEEGLHALHEKYKLNGKPSSTSTKRESRTQSQEQPMKKPFALVAEVTSGSPSDRSGLLKDDLIVAFGAIDIDNNRGLKGIVDVVFENTPVKLTVLRNLNVVHLTLIPSKWEGRGLLGCHIKPYS